MNKQWTRGLLALALIAALALGLLIRFQGDGAARGLFSLAGRAVPAGITTHPILASLHAPARRTTSHTMPMPAATSTSTPAPIMTMTTVTPTVVMTMTTTPYPTAQPGVVTILGVTADTSSVKITIRPVPRAADYRVFDQANPRLVKYAGMVHDDAGYGQSFVMASDGTPDIPLQARPGTAGPRILDIPSPEIEWNRLDDGKPHTLIVQALDALGPVPPSRLSTIGDKPAYPAPHARTSAAMDAMASMATMTTTVMTSTMTGMPTTMLGSNEGQTDDGLTSINGQGPPHDRPRVIAQSAPVRVSPAPGRLALPSRPDATGVFFDAFTSAATDPIAPLGGVNASTMGLTETMGAGTAHAWTIIYRGVDTTDTRVMVHDGHLMDILFDGGSPGSNNPLHTAHASLALSPSQTLDLSGGKMAHLTMEVDATESGRRWVGFNLTPANDPLTDWYGGSDMNRSKQSLSVQLFPDMATADLSVGPRSATDPTPRGVRFWGAAGQTMLVYGYRDQIHWGGNGRGLDNRSRFDLFLTRTRLALFEDGMLVQQSMIPDGGLPFERARAYFTHYVYHTTNDHADLLRAMPWMHYWIEEFPWSDERHWDNLGLETLPARAVPAGTDWSFLTRAIE